MSRLAADMRHAEVSRAGQRIGQPHSGNRHPGGRLLSVAEAQQELRDLLARPHPDTTPPTVGPDQASGPSDQARWPAREALSTRGDSAARGRFGGGDTGPEDRGAGGDTGILSPGWVTLLAGHAGAGASTVALAISDAAAAAGRPVHLVETCGPSRSGLAAAASAELGLDHGQGWRRGSRGRITIDRRSGGSTGPAWPSPVGEDAITVVDLGLPSAEAVGLLTAAGCRTVVVARATVPGMRHAEQLLGMLAGQPRALAVVGTSRWAGAVTASLGPLLRGLRADRGVVAVPLDRRLEVTGPTDAPLPKPVVAAGRALLELLDDPRQGAATTWAWSAPVPRGST